MNSGFLLQLNQLCTIGYDRWVREATDTEEQRLISELDGPMRELRDVLGRFVEAEVDRRLAARDRSEVEAHGPEQLLLEIRDNTRLIMAQNSSTLKAAKAAFRIEHAKCNNNRQDQTVIGVIEQDNAGDDNLIFQCLGANNETWDYRSKL